MPFNDEQKNAIASLLPKYLPAERFLSLCQIAEKSYALRECTPQSVLNCLIEAAKIGLEPNTPLQHCWLIPYRHAKTNKTYAQLIIGWRGLVHRAALASGARVEAHVVHAGEKIKYRPTDRKTPIVHEPTLDADDDDIDSIIGAYAIAFLPNGDVQAEWMSRSQIDRIRAGSKAANDGPWVTHFAEMARKCPTRRLAKYLQLSGTPDEVERFGATLDMDNLFDSKGTEEDEPPPQIAAPAPQQEPPKKRGRPVNPPKQQAQSTPAPQPSAPVPPSAEDGPELCGLCHQPGHDFNDCPNATSAAQPKKQDAGVAQTEEQGTRNAQVAGSIPAAGSPETEKQPNPPPPANGNDRALSPTEYDDLFQEARKLHPQRTGTWIIELLEDNFGLQDLSDLKVSQIGKFSELMQLNK